MIRNSQGAGERDKGKRVVGKEREGGEKEERKRRERERERERQGRVEVDSEEEAEVDKGDKLTINDISRS